MAKFQCNFISYVLTRAVDITVVIPTATIPEALGLDGSKASHIGKGKYPVLYLLHGVGNNHATWGGYSNIELFAEERNIAVVMISGENRFYRSVPGGDDYYRFIEEELPEFVTNMFPVSREPEHTYIAGLSMGGAGALMHGLANPEKFAAIGALSSALAISGSVKANNPWGMPDPRETVENSMKEGKKIPPVYMACGEPDGNHPENLAFQEFLEEKGVQVTWDSVPGFGHEWRFWNIQIEKFLDWIPRTDGYAGCGLRKI